MGTLYVVGTPIGNLEDITLRALRILGHVDLIAAEDTRAARKLLTHYDIKTPLTSYWEHNKLTKLDRILQALQQQDVGLISRAGMPGISDPGYELIKAAINDGIDVVPVPGPSAPVAALVVSGLPTDSFLYLGFLPRKRGKRTRLLSSLEGETRTLVAFEAPHRLLAALGDVKETLGDRPMAVTRELTKLHEEVFKGTISEAIDHFTEPRGEFTLVIEGETKKAEPQVTKEIEKELIALRESGLTAREAIGKISKDTGLSRKILYQTWLKR